jgi:hypoxanthine-guanine phosphoribosyltransferase
MEECQPRSLRLAVLFDKPEARKVILQPAYPGFAAASKYWAGYGSSGKLGLFRNLPFGRIGTRAIGTGTRRRHQGARRVSRG